MLSSLDSAMDAPFHGCPFVLPPLAQGFALEHEPLTWSPSAAATRGTALERGTLWMAYQPIVRWPDARVVAYEALLRSADHGDRFPFELHQRAMERGRTREFGRTIRRHIAASLPYLPMDADVYVNVERAELLDDHVLGADDPLAPWSSRIVLEVAERGNGIPCSALRERILELRAQGYRVALDDLGAGHNGLSAFAELDVDAVKIDMSLVRDVDTNATKRRVVGFLHELCREAGIVCIDEGVETEGERDTLVALGADLLQGFLLGRPRRIPSEAI